MSDIDLRWLGSMQLEIGLLKTNLLLRDIQIETLQAAIAEGEGLRRVDAALIDALKERAFAAEKAGEELREMIRPMQRQIIALEGQLDAEDEDPSTDSSAFD